MLFLILDWKQPLFYLGGDSKQYIDYANNLSLLFGDTERFSASLIVRTPGFPTLLWLAQHLSGGDLRVGLLLLHTTFAAGAVFLCAWVFRDTIPIVLSGLAVGLTIVLSREIFPAVVTEWTAMMLLLIEYALCVRYLSANKKFDLYCFTFGISLLVLIKPIFVFSLVLPLFLAWKREVLLTAKLGRVLLTSLIYFPILVVVLVNEVRFRTLSISPAGSLSFAAVLASFGASSQLETDSIQFKNFVEQLEKRRVTASVTELEKLRDLEAEGLFSAAAINYDNFMALREDLGLKWMEFLGLVNEYIKRGLVDYHSLYWRFVVSGLLSLFESLWMVIPGLLLPFCFLSRVRERPVAQATIFFYIGHLLQVVTTCFFGVIHSRYYNLTYFPMLTISLASTFFFIFSLLKKERSLSS